MRLVRSGALGALVAVATGAAVAVSAAPASAAVAPFKAKVRIAGTSCYDGHSQTSSSGVTRGVLECERPSGEGGELVLFSGNGNSYTRTRTGVVGKPVAFAADGTSSFVLYQRTENSAVMLLKRNRATGRQTKITISAKPGGTLDSGALLVSKGKYWAAYTVNNGAILWGSTRTKQNLIPSLPSRMPAVPGWSPGLARRGTTGGVTMVVAQPPPFEAGQITRFSSRANGTWSRSELKSAWGNAPQVMWSKGVTHVSWLRRTSTGSHKVMHEHNASGKWVRRAVPGLAGTGQRRLRMFSTGGKLTFVYTGRAAGKPTSDSQIVVTQRSGGTWSTKALGASGDGNLLLGAGGWSGKTIVVYYAQYGSPKATYSRRQA